MIVACLSSPHRRSGPCGPPLLPPRPPPQPLMRRGGGGHEDTRSRGSIVDRVAA